MPTVPSATDRLVQPQALPNVRQSIGTDASMFGGAQARGMQGIAQGLETASNNMDRIAAMMDAEDTRKAREAWASANADTDVLTSEARARQGVDVRPKGKPTVSQDFNEKLSGVYGKYTQGLSPSARAKFDSMWGPFATVRQQQIVRHEEDEQVKVDVSISEVSLSKAQGDIAAAVGQGKVDDPLVHTAVEEAKRRMAAEATYIGRLKKEAPDVIDARISMDRTKGHLNAVSALVAGDRSQEAQAYYDRYREEIDPRVRAEVEAKLKVQTEVTKSQEAADSIWAKSGGDLTAALEKVRKDYSGDLEEKIVTQIKTRALEKDAAKKRTQDASFNAALGKILDAQSPTDALNAAMKADVEPELRLRLVAVAENRARREAADDHAGNPVGLVEVMTAIDRGEITDPKAAQAAMEERKGSKKEIGDAVKYLQQGGLAGEVKVSRITTMAKDWNKNISDAEVAALTQYIIGDLKAQAAGKPVTDEELQQRVAGYMWKGQTAARTNPTGRGEPETRWFNRTWGETALQARMNRGIQSWLPDITSDEEKALLAEYMARFPYAVPEKVSTEQLRMFKKEKAGLPMGVAQPLAPPPAPINATGRSKSAEATAIINNTGQN